MNSSGSKGNPKSGKPVNIRGSALGKGNLRQIYDKSIKKDIEKPGKRLAKV
mgnify:CR=1 FL=1